MLKVHSIETFGTHEGPGIRLVIFLQGCNIRCLYCHNPDLLSCRGGQNMTVTQILDLAQKEREYFQNGGGLTVSGGEPTLQASAVYRLFKQAQKIGLHTALDTNGTLFTPATKKLYNQTDLLLLDVKHIDDQLHRQLTGVSNQTVLKTAKYREDSQKPMWLRYVLVPTFNDQPQFLTQWAHHFQNYKTIKRVEILPYHTLGVYKYQQLGLEYKLSHLAPPTPESINQAKKIFDQYFQQVVVK